MGNPRPAILIEVVAVGLLALLVAVMSARPLTHDDLFWHMRTGELVLETGSVPTTDPFSHTLPGAPWTSHEWGFGLITHALASAAGLIALVHLQQVITLALFALLYAVVRRALASQRRALAVPLLLVGLCAAYKPLFIMRAALFSSLLLVLLSYLLWRLQRRSDRRAAIAIAVLFLVWANLHAGVVFGLAALGLHVLQRALQAWLDGERQPAAIARGAAGQLALLLAACAALTLVNPNGLNLWTFSFEANRLVFHSGLRWSMGHYAAPTLSAYPVFYALLALFLLACLPPRGLLALLRSRTSPLLGQWLCALLFLVLALRSSRFIPEFVIFAVPFCAARWGAAPSAGAPEAAAAWPGRLAQKLGARAELPSHLLGIALVALAAAIIRPEWPRSPLSSHFPKVAVEFMRREGIAGRMFNPENFGGYLGYYLRIPVYWDGRNDVFLPIARQYAHAGSFGELVDAHGLELLVMHSPYGVKFGRYLRERRDLWSLVYFDETVALYVKRIARFANVIARWDYTLLQPFGIPGDGELQRVARTPALAQRADREAARLIEQNRQTFAGWYIRGALAQARGDNQAAYGFLKRALALSGNARTMYRLSQVALALGRHDEARDLVTRALQHAKR